jgi:hypothetical protein
VGFEPELRKNEAFDVGFCDGPVNVGHNEPRIFGQKVDRKWDLDVQGIDDKDAVI